jgi:hypothetical protein
MTETYRRVFIIVGIILVIFGIGYTTNIDLENITEVYYSGLIFGSAMALIITALVSRIFHNIAQSRQ